MNYEILAGFSLATLYLLSKCKVVAVIVTIDRN